MNLNRQSCRRHWWPDDNGPCLLCNEPRHRGLDHKGVMRACIQEVHFCWGIEDDFALERGKMKAGDANDIATPDTGGSISHATLSA